MSVAMFSQWPPAAPDSAQRVAERIMERLGGGFPEGGLYHAEGPSDDGGWWTFNVWSSADAYQRFNQDVLQPVLAELGLPSGQAQQLQVAWDTLQPPGAS